MPDIYQLGDGERVPFKVLVSKSLPGDTVTVRSSNPDSALVTMDTTPMPGTVASGTVFGGNIPRSGVAIQATVTHPDKSTSVSVFVVDVGGGDPPAPPPPPPVEPIRAHLTLGPSAASKAPKADPPAPKEK